MAQEDAAPLPWVADETVGERPGTDGRDGVPTGTPWSSRVWASGEVVGSELAERESTGSRRRSSGSG